MVCFVVFVKQRSAGDASQWNSIITENVLENILKDQGSLKGSHSGFSKFHVLVRWPTRRLLVWGAPSTFTCTVLQSYVVVVFVLGQHLQVDFMKCTEEARVILEETGKGETQCQLPLQNWLSHWQLRRTETWLVQLTPQTQRQWQWQSWSLQSSPHQEHMPRKSKLSPRQPSESVHLLR